MRSTPLLEAKLMQNPVLFIDIKFKPSELLTNDFNFPLLDMIDLYLSQAKASLSPACWQLQATNCS